MDEDDQLIPGEAFTCYLQGGMRQDLKDLKRHSGESMSQLVCKGIGMLMRERARTMKPTTMWAERLLARYGRSKE